MVSLLTAAVVFAAPFALVVPATTMDNEMAAAEPGIEVAQPAPETIMAEPIEAEPIEAAPGVDEPVMTEPVIEEPAIQPEEAATEDAPEEPAGQSEPEAAEYAPEEPAIQPEEAATEDAPEEPAGQPKPEAAEDAPEEQDGQPGDEDYAQDPENSESVISGPFIYDTADYIVTVSSGPEAQLPAGTTMTWGEYITGSSKYDSYRYLVDQKLIEAGTAETDLENAVASLRVFTLHFVDINGAEIRPAAPVDVLVEYKTPANPVTNEKLYAVTFRTDDGRNFRASLSERNARDNTACVEAAGGVIQKLRVQDLAANDYNTDMSIAQLAWQQAAEEPAEDPAEDTEEPSSEEAGEDAEEQSAEEIEDAGVLKESFSISSVAVFGDIVENTPYMNIRVHSSIPMIKALKDTEEALFEGRDVVGAYEIVPRSSRVNVTVKIAGLPESSQGDTFELCVVKDGTVVSLGEAVLDSVFSFRADEADAFALVKSQAPSHTLTGAYGVALSGNFPEGASVRVSETEPVEMDGIRPEAAFAYDIKIYDSNDQEWQPAAGETLECFVPCEGTQEELEQYYWVVLHTSDGVTEQLFDAAPVDGGIRFTTGSFSTFTLRAQVTGKSLIGSSTVHFVDHQGNEIQGAVSGTIDYTYREPYDMWAYADRLDPSIAGDYEFSRVYLQLSGMQKDFRYIYLGTNADAGQSGSSYKIYFFMNSIEECRTGGTYNGTWYTFSSGTKWSDDIYIVFNHVEDVAFNKADVEGDPVSDAGFTLYTDESCINALTYNGSAVTAVSDASGRVDFGRIPYGTYYMKETATPSGFKETGKVYTVNVNGNTSIGDIVNEDDDGSIIVKETRKVNITKEWGDSEEHSGDTVTIKLFDQGTEAGSVTLTADNNWSQSIDNLDPSASYVVSETSVTSSGEDVTSGWIPTISAKTASTATAYYQSNGFQQGEQYVIVYNGNTALRNNDNTLSTTSVTVQNNMLTSIVNDQCH